MTGVTKESANSLEGSSHQPLQHAGKLGVRKEMELLPLETETDEWAWSGGAEHRAAKEELDKRIIFA